MTKKLSYKIALLLFSVFLMSCESAVESDSEKRKKHNNISKVGNPFEKGKVDPDTGEMYQYRFVENGCDTKTRVALTQEQLCRNLQIGSGICALSARKGYFADNCDGKTWDVDAATSEAILLHGTTMECFFTERKRRTGEQDLFSQFTGDNKLIMKHDYHYAVVEKSLVNDVFSLSLEIRSDEGKLVKRLSKSWKNFKSDALSVATSTRSVSLECYPEIH